jgi:hypothetical protein
MDRTPRLSSASGVTLICFGNVVQHFVSVRVYFYVGVAFNVVWWAMTILTPLIAGDWDLEKSGRLLAGRFQECVSPPAVSVFWFGGCFCVGVCVVGCWCHKSCGMCG